MKGVNQGNTGKDGNRADQRLNTLFAAYREACPDPEAGPDFMPGLWRKIESRRVDPMKIFRRLAQACALAAALTVLIGVLMPRAQNDALESATYVDELAAAHTAEIADVVPGGDLL